MTSKRIRPWWSDSTETASGISGAIHVIVCAHVCAPAYLRGSICGRVGVHVPDVLPVAFGHLDDLGTDFEGLTATLLRCPSAALANRECDWVARAARVLGALQS